MTKPDSGTGRPASDIPAAATFGFDFSSPDLQRDPYPYLARLRESAPLASIPAAGHPLGRVLIATSYPGVVAVAGDAANFSSDSRTVFPDSSGMEPSMISQDPPAHTRLRSRVAADFTPKRVAALEEPIRRIIDESLLAAMDKGSFDLITDLALPVPVLVICELLGIPEADRPELAHWSHEFIDSSGLGTSGTDNQSRNLAASMALQQYFVGFVQKRQVEPDDGLVSALLQPSEDPLSFAELVSMCVLLLVAGHETTVNLIGNGVRTLLRHPEQWRRLVEDPALAAGVVEESLRFEPPVQRALFRASRQAVELAGFELSAGEQVMAAIAAANRDPAVFTDPDRFDITRQPNRHLSFGRGVHFCLGAPLARLEGRLVFERLAAVAPNLRVEGEDDAWRPSTIFRGLRRLEVVAG